MPRRSWEKLGGAWRHVLAQGVAGARQALGATGKGWLTCSPLGSGDNQRQAVVKSVLGSLDDPDFLPHPHVSPSFTHSLLLTSLTSTSGPLNGC